MTSDPMIVLVDPISTRKFLTATDQHMIMLVPNNRYPVTIYLCFPVVCKTCGKHIDSSLDLYKEICASVEQKKSEYFTARQNHATIKIMKKCLEFKKFLSFILKSEKIYTC